MKKKNYMPKTPKEKGLFVGAIICIVVFIPCLIFIMEGIGIIPFLIIAILAICGGMALAFYAKKIIDARLKEEEESKEQPKVEEPVKAKEPEPVKHEAIPEPAPAPEVVEPEQTIEEPVFEEEPAPVQPVEKKKPNKAVFAVIIPIVAVVLVAAIAIPVTIHFVNANSNTEINDGGGNNNNNGGKVSFNITSTTRYEETSTDRVDGYQFEPNKDYIQYRFIRHGDAYYVEWIEHGTWTFDASTGFVNAVCTTYETWDDYTSSWNNHTYSEGASNAQKSFKVVNDTTLYWNGNSQFAIKKVSSFTHPIVKYNGQ
jgi:flagellar basal body-associated protein FliL